MQNEVEVPPTTQTTEQTIDELDERFYQFGEALAAQNQQGTIDESTLEKPLEDFLVALSRAGSKTGWAWVRRFQADVAKAERQEQLFAKIYRNHRQAVRRAIRTTLLKNHDLLSYEDSHGNPLVGPDVDNLEPLVWQWAWAQITGEGPYERFETFEGQPDKLIVARLCAWVRLSVCRTHKTLRLREMNRFVGWDVAEAEWAAVLDHPSHDPCTFREIQDHTPVEDREPSHTRLFCQVHGLQNVNFTQECSKDNQVFTLQCGCARFRSVGTQK